MKIFLIVIVLSFLTALSSQSAAQSQRQLTTQTPPEAPAVPEHTYEGLNTFGSDISLPPFHETVGGENAAWRRAMMHHGMAFRIDSLPIFSANTLAGPVSSDQQTYVGQRPFMKWGSSPILTWDMKALHLNDAQLEVALGLEYETWGKAGPNATDFNSLYFFKGLDEGRFELKAGYFDNHFEFVGLQAGGSLLTGTQGVYAVLPYEAGMSAFPEITPAFNLKWNAPAHFYAKGSLQRAPDATGAQPTIDKNRVGLRFDPKGDKLVTIGEAGYRQAASDTADTANWIWLRGGYLHNSTPYANSVTGTKTSGNYCGYLLGDRQMTRNPGPVANNGIYVGASAMVVPASMNVYTQYYELRTYDEGPFRTRPADTISVVVTHSVYSRDTVKNLIAQHKSYWRNSTSFTGSYTVRAARGVYFSMGVSYIAGPAVTPHVANALVASVAPAIFF